MRVLVPSSRFQAGHCHREYRRSCRTRAVAVPESLNSEWRTCVEQLVSTGLDAAEADVVLRKAHGWGFQASHSSTWAARGLHMGCTCAAHVPKLL